MQKPQSNLRTRPNGSRLLIAVMTAISMVAGSGFFAAPAQAQGVSQFVFQGAGWGHGVGMSQNGARNMADAGIDHVGILNFYYPNTVISPVGGLDNIRVHIGDAERVELTSSDSIVFERGGVAINGIPSGTITVSAHDGGLQIGNAWTTGSPTDPLFVSFPQPVTVANNGHRYLWGKLQLTNKNGKVRVVEVLPLEDYVAGIAEMPAAWPLEALMAQAIAARTYAHEVTLHRRNSAEWAQEYDISGSTVDQNYIGYDAQDSAWDQKWLAAVKATAGVEIIDSNGPVRAYYSASNGGYTETAAYVFNNDVAHTVAGPDPYDAGGHDWTDWTRTYSQSDLSRWLNASADTAVGTVTSINVAGGAGASARLDRAVVEIIGTGGSKRVTGKRLMLVINAGVFGEGGGLSTHLPGTFTTIGNGAAAGSPLPSGAPVPTTITPDPVADDVGENEGFTPPPGWQPEPGTGVAPGSATAAGEDADSDGGTEERGTFAADGTFIPPEGWQPEPGSGVNPDGETAATDTAGDTFTPPPGWAPEPGTGVAPRSGTADTGTDNAETDAGDASFTPPPGWSPEPGTGVAPRATTTATANATASSDATTSGDATATSTFTPPAGWAPEPGSGVPPSGTTDNSSAGDSTPAAATTATATDEADATGDSDDTTDTETVGGTGGGYIPPEDWEPATGTGTAPTATSSTSSAIASSASGYQPPAGWSPEPGTGVAPKSGNDESVGGTGGGDASASGVFLVTRSASGSELEDAKFEVIAPTSELAAEARQRLEELQAKAALGLFADVDADGYVASVAPQPIHGVCTATVDGVTCVPLAALQDGDN